MTTGTSLPPIGFGFVSDASLSAEGLAALLGVAELPRLLDLLPIAVIVTAPDDSVLHFNAGAEAAFGLRRATVIGKTFACLRHDALLDMEGFLRACAQGRDAGVVRARHGGARYAASRHLVPGDGGSHALYFLRADYAREVAARRAPVSGSAELLLTPAIEHLADRAAVAVARRTTVLLLGETGVGKTMLARSIHARSSRRDAPFVHVNCGSIPESLFESELFGYERGAFTGALGSGKRGYIEAAAGGTLFLDELGELPLELQPKLLRAVELGEVIAVGSTQRQQVDVRVVAATNRSLADDVARGKFRRDLHARMTLWQILVPPLRARRSDLLGWLDRLHRAWCDTRGHDELAPLELNTDAALALLLHGWPDNLRGLQRVLHGCATTSPRAPLSQAELAPLLVDPTPRSETPPPRPTSPPASPTPTPEQDAGRTRRPRPGREELVAVLTRLGWSIRATAKHYACERKQISRWIERYAIEPPTSPAGDDEAE